MSEEKTTLTSKVLGYIIAIPIIALTFLWYNHILYYRHLSYWQWLAICSVWMLLAMMPTLRWLKYPMALVFAAACIVQLLAWMGVMRYPIF